MKAGVALAAALFLALPAWAGRAVVDWKDGVRVYSAAGQKNARRVGHIAARIEVETQEESGNWVRVKYPGGEGWVSSKSLRMLPGRKAPAPKPEEVPKAAPAVRPASRDPSTPEAASPQPLAPPAPAAAPAPAEAAPVASVASTASTTERQGVEGGYLSRYDREEPAAKADTGPGLFTVVSALLLVLALVAGGVYLLKILSGRRYPGGQKGRGIQILASRALGPRQALLLVEVGGLPLLLAQGDGIVNLLAEIRDADAVKRLNDLYGFRETPFEAELHKRLDVESREGGDEEGVRERLGPSPEVVGGARPAGRGGQGEPGSLDLSPEERLAALRRRRRPGEEP